MSLLSAQDLHFSYRGGHRNGPALQAVTLEVKDGELLALIGPNGAGKSTLLKLLAGLLKPQQGSVRAPQPRAKHIAYLAQAEALPNDFLVRDVVALGRLPHQHWWGGNPDDERAVQQALERTNTLALASRRILELSGGERQRVALARALAQSPQILLLDEPTNHLDVGHQAELLALLRKVTREGLAVVMVVHDLSLAGCADRVALLHHGRLERLGPASEVLEQTLLQQVYQTPLERLVTADGRAVVVPRL